MYQLWAHFWETADYDCAHCLAAQPSHIVRRDVHILMPSWPQYALVYVQKTTMIIGIVPLSVYGHRVIVRCQKHKIMWYVCIYMYAWLLEFTFHRQPDNLYVECHTFQRLVSYMYMYIVRCVCMYLLRKCVMLVRASVCTQAVHRRSKLFAWSKFTL